MPLIRKAKMNDREAVQQISADAYTPAYMAVIGAVPKPAIEDYRTRIEKGEVWLLEADEAPAGIAVFEEHHDHLLVYSIAVKPEAQGRGYGAALLRFAEQRAAAGGKPEIRLYTNQRMERNVALYRGYGYIAVGTRPHPSRAGEVLIDFVRKVPSS